MRCLVVLLAVSACGRFAFDPQSSGDDATGGDAGRDGPGGDTAIVPDGAFAANVVFVTSTVVRPGDLGGLAGADAICNARAAAAGFPGTYVAWLSSSTTDALARLGQARGWVRPDGLPFVDTVADLAAGRTLYALNIDELGAVFNPRIDEVRSAITATQGNGLRTTETCGDYTQVTASTTVCGMVSGGTRAWTDEAEAICGCDELSSLYCFGVDRQVPVSASSSGPRAFVSALWPPGAGLAAADTQCQFEATAAGLPGTFRALLSTSTASAASRFTQTSPVWRRVDGVALATSRTAMMTGTLMAALDRTASGQPTELGVWTGAIFDGDNALTVASPGYSCADWTASDVGSSGASGRPTFAGPRFFARSGGSSCNGNLSLYCLED